MKRLPIILLVVFVSMVASAKGKKQLVILHTNDTHSTIFALQVVAVSSVVSL